jgi:hypothetical protein
MKETQSNQANPAPAPAAPPAPDMGETPHTPQVGDTYIRGNGRVTIVSVMGDSVEYCVLPECGLRWFARESRADFEELRQASLRNGAIFTPAP